MRTLALLTCSRTATLNGSGVAAHVPVIPPCLSSCFAGHAQHGTNKHGSSAPQSLSVSHSSVPEEAPGIAAKRRRRFFWSGVTYANKAHASDCLQAAVYGSRSAVLTPELFRSVLQMKLREHQQRRAFTAEDPTAALA